MSIVMQAQIAALQAAVLRLSERLDAVENGVVAAPPVYSAVPTVRREPAPSGRRGWPKGKPRSSRKQEDVHAIEKGP